AVKFMGPYLDIPDAPKDEARHKLEERVAAVDQQMAERTKKLEEEMPKWEQQFKADLSKVTQTHALEVADFDSLGDSNIKKLEDNSVLLVDDAPDKDTYVVTVHTKLTGITGIKLEALTDASLPGKGPG